jgi:hypothetical protein
MFRKENECMRRAKNVSFQSDSGFIVSSTEIVILILLAIICENSNQALSLRTQSLLVSPVSYLFQGSEKQIYESKVLQNILKSLCYSRFINLIFEIFESSKIQCSTINCGSARCRVMDTLPVYSCLVLVSRTKNLRWNQVFCWNDYAFCVESIHDNLTRNDSILLWINPTMNKPCEE